jgi:tRNA (guanine-N7-)-methyltransferase
MNDSTASHPRREIRSFVKRAGRLTQSQARALQELWPRYGATRPEGRFDFTALFERDAPVHLEIGFGMGDTLAEMAANAPEVNFLGIEVHEPGVGRLLNLIEERGLSNLRVMQDDAAEVLRDHIAPASLAAVYLFFPDPWHKKKHHKRRLVQPALVELLAERLEPNGLFHMATDWEDYALWARDVLEDCDYLDNAVHPGAFADKPAWRPETKFERRGLRLGHGTWDLLYRRNNKA